MTTLASGMVTRRVANVDATTPYDLYKSVCEQLEKAEQMESPVCSAFLIHFFDLVNAFTS